MAIVVGESRMGKTQGDKGAKARVLTPLWVISLFVTFTEVALGAATTQTIGGVQVALTAFVILFPILIAGGFFGILWSRPWVFYSPHEYGAIDARSFIEALQGRPAKLVTKTGDLGNEVIVFGDPDQFQLLFKAKGGTWRKSTKAMGVPGGCVVQVSTEQMNLDGSSSVAEALTYVPGVLVQKDVDGLGKHLVASPGPEHRPG
jgi:hypothetical protein